MPDERPDPDALLREISKSETKAKRGRLKVFLGMAAGVGKTYSMLSEAQEQKGRGIDVVAGYIEPHGRAETEALLKGHETLPLLEVEHRGVTVKEFNLDAALERRPTLILVDELAHTNAPGSRHRKRWQDIEELLDAGIDVYSTVNIQHVESLNDVVAKITGVVVRETVPDIFLEQADEVEMVDIPPEELLQRLNEGKVYVPHQVAQALKSFFRKGNLIALRELALRHTADRVRADMQSYRTEHAVREVWPAASVILVCIAPNALASRVVRAARRLGTMMHAETVAAYVESSRQAAVSPSSRAMAEEALRLAESLGMQTVTLSGNDIVAEIVRFARARNVTLIVVGKPVRPRWREILFGSVVDELVRHSGEIDVQVLTGREEDATPHRSVFAIYRQSVKSWVYAVLAPVLSTGLVSLVHGALSPGNLILVYLLGVAAVASRAGPLEAVISALLSIVLFDVFFVEPIGTFTFDPQYLATLLMMGLVSLIVSAIALRLRLQARSASERERRTGSLYSLSRELAQSRGAEGIATAARDKIAEIFDGEVAICLPDENGRLRVAAPSGSRFEDEPSEFAVAQWCYDHKEIAGHGSNTLPGASGVYFPLEGSKSAMGVLALRQRDQDEVMDAGQTHLYETFANQTALALERTLFAVEAERASVRAEAEKMRATLLNSVSSELRTPLTVITGAASQLIDNIGLDETRRQELTETVYDEAWALNRMVRNMLDITRLESSNIELDRQPAWIREIVQGAMDRTLGLLGEHEVRAAIPEDLPSVHIDAMLMEQVLVNLLENAARHTPRGTEIELSAAADPGWIRIEVADRGPGIPPDRLKTIFDKFQRGESAIGRGAGLGLPICSAILAAHNGRIWAENREGGGSVFKIDLPSEDGAATRP